MPSACWDDYFYSTDYHSTHRPLTFAAPNLRTFLLELANDLEYSSSERSAEERNERARNRAEHAEEALSIGTTDIRPNFRSGRVQ